MDQTDTVLPSEQTRYLQDNMELTCVPKDVMDTKRFAGESTLIVIFAGESLLLL